MDAEPKTSNQWPKKIGEGFIVTFLGTLFGSIGLLVSNNNFLIAALFSGIGAIVGVILGEYLFPTIRTASKNVKSIISLKIADIKEEKIALFLVLFFSLIFHRIVFNIIAYYYSEKPFVHWDTNATMIALSVSIFVFSAISSGILNAIQSIRTYGWGDSFGEKVGDCFMWFFFTVFSGFYSFPVYVFFMLCSATAFFLIKIVFASFGSNLLDLSKNGYGTYVLGLALLIAEIYGVKVSNSIAWQMSK